MSFELDCGGLMNHSMFVKQPLMLDGEKGESAKGPGKLGKNSVVLEPKAMAALKSHSEAERRRRERINAQLDTLRGLVPSHDKMDKAALLAEVIRQVKQLKTEAAQASEGLHIPTDTDAVEVTILENNATNNSFLLKASLCCDYRPELLSDIRQAINDLPVHILKCEISTLGGRMKSAFLLTRSGSSKNTITWEAIVCSVRRALAKILEVSASAECDQLIFPRKRHRQSCS